MPALEGTPSATNPMRWWRRRKPPDALHGCDYCREYGNQAYGHVTQIATHSTESALLLRCPMCAAYWEWSTEWGREEVLELSEEEARIRFSEHTW